ncbi:hypothetical protein PISL3812_09425 [Talaromyces islandicus]|uniref:Uncharacterized protein n=1 Tax=Talaromyces islandicus TaxID=28573 RepID=A0A0U1M9S8_TALIS|nr:hypothetical protein PISL3812_09425 [Talaromyces islandicus]
MSLNHLAKCSARPIATADILYDDIGKNKFLEDGKACEAFGFNRCSHWREESHLLGLYRGFLLYLQDPEINPVNLNEWQQNGLLATRIIEKFSAIPEKSRGTYFPWFCEINNSKPSLRPDSKSNPIALALDAARPSLEPGDRDKDPRELEPLEKSDYDQSLGVMPKNIPSLPTCSFDEIWRAWQNSTAELFENDGKGNLLDEISGSLREFMSYPVEKHGLRPSVWRFKHLLALDDNTPSSGFPEIEAAAQDYGFRSQLDARTKMDLRQFYRQLLKVGDPLEVHKAKERGELLDYAEILFGDIDNRVRDVLVEMSSTRGA